MSLPRVRVRLYATARVAAGRETVDLPVPASGVPARDLVRRLAREFPDLAPLLPACRFVRNDEYLADLRARVRPGDAFAVHPPYGGG
ncbi:MAG: MoaD/ThiS family protein [Thermoplasmata archaeon]